MDYPNPLIPGFNPDPSCVRVDGAYYLVTSSFEYLPALPVYRSTDLITWDHIANVGQREEQVELSETPSGFGVWAPTIRYHSGWFYVIVIITRSPRRCVVFSASNPAGPWSDGTTIEGIVGIDPDLAWDEHGTCHVTYAGLVLDGPSAGTHGGIMQVRVDLDAGRTLGEPYEVWSGTGLMAPEGPHLYQMRGYWYLLIAEGGTGRGHAVSIARGPSIAGPFAPAPHNPILTAAGSDRPIISTGHADLVTTASGEDVLVLLGTRTVDSSGRFSPLGRETFVTPVAWNDGWPTPEPVALNPRLDDVHERFEFSDPGAFLDPGWLSVGQLPGEYSSSGASGLSVPAQPGGMRAPRPAYVARRQRHLVCRIECTVETGGGSGGLALRIDERSAVTITAGQIGGSTRVTATAILPSLEQSWTVEVRPGPVTLIMDIGEPRQGESPWAGTGDLVRLAVCEGGGEEHSLTELDGRYWSIEVAAPFTGRTIGMFAEAGVPTFSNFDYFGQGGT